MQDATSLTTVLNLYSGPGAGKSTTAAFVFAHLKKQGVNAELVTEYVKGWAWIGRRVQPLDQFYLFGKQLHRESNLYGKVDVIVTDSPIGIAAYYASKYCPADMAEAVRLCHNSVRAQNLAKYVDVALVRSKAYNPKGRYETESEAKSIDAEMFSFLRDTLNIDYHLLGTEDIHAFLDLVAPPQK